MKTVGVLNVFILSVTEAHITLLMNETVKGKVIVLKETGANISILNYETHP